MIFVFYISMGLLLYSYALYPLVLLALDLPRRLQQSSNRPAASSDRHSPAVSLLLAVHNEEQVIADKIANFLASDYPGPSQIVIVSDGSTDRTVELASRYSSSRVCVIAEPVRRGKGATINRGAQYAKGEILAFTDANAFFAPDTISRLVEPFADASVGLVTGATVYPKGSTGSLYQRYEQMLKRLESLGGVVATADGAVYAMRRSLWQEHDPSLINDFMGPIVVSLQGAKALMEPRALCFEEFSLDKEFSRQVRMVSQASFVYLKCLPQLLAARRWRSVLVLTSHKLLRWLTAPLLALLLLSTLALQSKGGLYRVAVDGEVVLAALAVIGRCAQVGGFNERVGLVYQFLALNGACALGLWRCIRGSVPVTWKPRSL